MQKKASKTLER